MFSETLKYGGMDLLTYTKSCHGRAAALADELGYARSQISQWAHGVRPVPVMAALDIERYTQGAVMRWDLRPNDWHLIWPELIGTAGAPPVPDDAHTEPTHHEARS